MPLGMVDMDQGEAYVDNTAKYWVNTDPAHSYAFADFIQCSALQRYFSLRLLVSGYDINCQYRVNFDDRIASMKRTFSGLSSIPVGAFPTTICAVGKFHLPAHIASCRYKYSYNFLPGAAMTDGEGCERKWSQSSGLSLRTKEMTTGHAHDVKNDVENDLNVRRTNNMGTCFPNAYLFD